MSKEAYPFLNNLDIDQDVTRRLSLLLDAIVQGNSEVFVTPLGADGRSTKILADLDTVFNSGTDRMNDTLISLENSNRDKFGPRSIAVPWKDRRKSVKLSFKPSKTPIDNVDIKPTRVGNLRPLSLSNALKLLKNNTNSGLPYFTRKSKVKESILKDFDVVLSKKYPCVCFTRTQESKKTRSVWGFPIGDTLNEMMYYSPLLEYQRNEHYRAALRGPDHVAQELCKMVVLANQSLRTLVSIDVAHYDDDFKVNLQIQVFEYFKLLFQQPFRSGLDYIRERFSTIGLITPDGIEEGDHGIPSGSTMTNEVGSVGQRIVVKPLSYIRDGEFQVQGDDGAYITPEGLADDLISQFEKFGFEVNRDKTYISRHFAIYLQCLYHIDFINKGIIGGIYPIYRALNRLVYQERWSDFEDYDISGKDYYSIRAICIMENCKHHPLFEEFVKVILKNDKYSLEFSEQGLKNYVQMISKSKGTEGILINQYGDDTKGLKNFETYKLIKRLSI